ncbi:MAG: hypothetical protein IJT63_03915 [Lachnospiraceae bacterium]|nr:hypothetical protein [Lachnospiraceae bacterium]
MTDLTLEGDIGKKMLGKDCLAGNGATSGRNAKPGIVHRDKNGKGLTIHVKDKKSQKNLKKQLKKAGAKKAKVKVNK